jgi:hypothetical protein
MVKGVSSLTALTEGTWHHLGMTWDGHTLRAFLDGVMQVTQHNTYRQRGERGRDKGHMDTERHLGVFPLWLMITYTAQCLTLLFSSCV